MIRLVRSFLVLTVSFIATVDFVVAQSSAFPVVTQVPDQDTWMNQGNQPISSHFELILTASNSPKNFSATGTPSGVDFYGNPSNPPGFFWNYGSNPGGRYTVTVTATNDSGVSAPMTFNWTVHPGLRSAIYSDNSQYHVGDVISLHARFTMPVVVTGTPYVQLWGAKRAYYASGSGTDLLSFTYQTTADDAGQSYAPSSISLNGGTIGTSDGVASSLDVPTSDGIGSNAYDGVGVASTPPTITQLSSDKSTYTRGEAVTMRAVFSAPVNVTGTPDITLNGPSFITHLLYVSGSGTDTLTFRYTFDATFPTGSYVCTSVDANGGTIGTSDGTAANLAIPQPAPSITLVAGTAAGPSISDQTINGTVGTPMSAQIAATNAVYYWNIQGLLPPGVVMDQNTGSITHTPTAAGTYTITVQVKDSSGNTAQAQVTFNIAASTDPNPPTINDQTIRAVVGNPLAGVVAAQNATSYRVSYGTLPAGLTLNATNGAVTGTPQTAGESSVKVEVKDNTGYTASATVTFLITAPASSGPTIADQTINGTIEVPINVQIQATNATYYWIYQGTIPPGVRVDTATGVLSGTPTTAGTWKVLVQVKDATGAQAFANVTFVIAGTNTQAVINDVTVDPGDHTFGVGLSVHYSREVDVTLQPVIHLMIGDQAVDARFGYPDLSGGDRHIAHFYYAVSNNVHGWLTIKSPIDLLNGAIRSDDGMDASLTFTPPDTSNVYVGAPPATGSTPPPVDNSGSNPPPTDTRTPPPAKTVQTISFSSPTSGLVIGQATTLGATSSAGLPITYLLTGGDATIKGNVLTPLTTDTIVVTATNAGNDQYTSASAQVNFGNPQPAPASVFVPAAQATITADQPVAVTTTIADTQPITYTVVSGPATVVDNKIVFTGTGNVTVRASTQVGNTKATMQDITVTAHPITRLVNISSRVHVSAGSDGAMVGFVVTGGAPKKILIRAVGESLAAFGVNDGLANPTLKLYGANSTLIATNTGWAGDAQIAAAANSVGAFGLAPGKTDAALLVTLPPGLYSAQVTSPNSGSVLLEVYDVAATDAVPTKQLINISTRAHVDASNQVFQGFVISGDQPKRVLLRAIGPALKAFGVNDAVTDPALKLYSGNDVIATNDNWSSAGTGSANVTPAPAGDIATASATVGAFGLPADSKDAAILVTLQPGLYSVVVSGHDTESGSVLVEAYEVP